MTPPIVGPAATPSDTTTAFKPSANPRSLLGNVLVIIAIFTARCNWCVTTGIAGADRCPASPIAHSVLERKTAMQHILANLQALDRLYREESLEAYERLWQETARLIRHELPGFTIAYAELYNSGMSRLSDAAMSHVLVPLADNRLAFTDVVEYDSCRNGRYYDT